METFQLELPRIFADHLNSELSMKRHLEKLKRDLPGRHYQWDSERQAIILITYHSAYGDSVDERRGTVARIGSWAVWSSAKPLEIHYVDIGDEPFTERMIPGSLLEAPLIPRRVPFSNGAAVDPTVERLW